ncbi:Yae1 family protein [Microtetraspora sp. AC03309]|uniref:Yae1 family protein n=1 Tax=Microtetraspora sp. AC03309 TaxID=2779376 RepID=UPI001E41F41A|nr:Yae1 family protein [Microtetraspora sp. AC03309]MCC5574312.1 Yae1 family protein [Microtetraspora sp. AC03309]
MPGIDHEMPIEFIRNSPMTAVELLRDAAGVQPPPFATAAVEAVDCTQLVPVEFRADSVVVLRDTGGAAQLALIVEIQNRHDARKRFSWPVYVTALRARLECATALMVICPDPPMARWSERPIPLGPSGTITPLAVHPGRIPLITDPDRARSCPELAVLSATAHAERPEIGLALEAMVAALETLDEDRAKLYFNYVFSVLPTVARKHLEEIVTTTSHEYESMAGQYLSHWIDRGRQEGLQEGRQEGLQEGRQEGLQEGRAEGEAAAILAVLDARGLEISPDARDRITRCSDLHQLETWIRRAVTVTSADDIFT